VFHKLWKLDGEFTATEPHIRDVLARCKGLFITDDWPKFLDNLVARLQSRQLVSMRFERPDSTVVDCSSVPLPDGATLISFIDVTDSTLVERSLRERTEALENADRVKTEFLANMSYELRSPLTSISGFSEMLTKEYAGALNAGQKDYVCGIYQSSQHLAALIGDIIDMATIDAGYLKLDRTSFALRGAIDGVIALLGERMKLQNVAITVHLAPGIDTLHADEKRVKQILINLLSNAVRVTKARGEVRVEVSRTEGGDTRLTVRDAGPGLDAERRAQLFNPFYRSGQSAGGESILSLSLVKRFMELHGGSVEVESEPGVGTAIACVFVNPARA
jgi:signal transduction histidine kinase